MKTRRIKCDCCGEYFEIDLSSDELERTCFSCNCVLCEKCLNVNGCKVCEQEIVEDENEN